MLRLQAVLAGLGGVILPLAAQVPSRIVMSPVPFWNDTAALQKPAAGKTAAFFDVAQNQLVLVSTDIAGSPHQVRLDVPNATKATITSASQSGNAGTTCTYGLADDPQARQRAQQFSILLPNSDTGVAAGSSGTWQYSTTNTDFPDRTGTVHMGTMRMVSWRDASNGNAKIVGAVFTLTSPYLPGFADAFVEGQVSTPLTAAAVSNLPAEISDGVKRFLQPGIGSAPHLLLAPLFQPGTAKSVIAANYHFGLSSLVRSGRISLESPYAQQLLQNLSLFLNAGATGTVASPSAAPGNQLEKAVQQAIALTLQ